MSVSGIKAGNPEQAELIRLIMENKTKIVFCIGDAGTGKNYCSIAAALQLQSDKKYKDIYYGRNPVQCGQEVGFTTGSLEEKLAIYMHPLYDTLENIAHKGGAFRAENARARVQMFEITTARGRSIDNAVVIIDECQNLDAKTLQTIITRMGTYSKLILIGSYNQIDLKSQ